MSSNDIQSLSLIKFSGEDALTFLQGQLTNDVSKLDNNWHFAGYCNPKGRLLALFKIWRRNDEFYALLHSSVLENVIKRMQMYVLRSKVTIEPLEKAQIAFFDNADSMKVDLANLSIDNDTKLSLYSLSDQMDVSVLGLQGAALLIDYQGKILPGVIESSNEQLWQSHCIDHGLPNIEVNTAEQFIPQMLNLDVLDGISFKKGCYTGQEIIARLHYLGKPKQRMYLCELEAGPEHLPTEISTHEIQTGTRIASLEGKNAGQTISPVVSSPRASKRFLAALRVDLIAEPLKLELEGTELNVQISDQQPYPLGLSA